MSDACLAAITIDYETWQPIPPGKRIDWDQDVFAPADRLMDVGETCGVPITFMAEMGEYFWLAANDPSTARRMKEQWQEAILRGHDVQLHLHPSWLPELGARCQDGQWWWDFSRAKADDYPGDLTQLLARCKQELEEPLQLIDPDYRAIAFRAGTYQVQPFRRLFEALVANGIIVDSSVFAGGFSVERGYDFRDAVHAHQPWFANPFDPQLRAAPAEQQLIELPVATFGPGDRWFLDGDEGPRLAARFQACRRHARSAAGEHPRFLGRLFGRLSLPWFSSSRGDGEPAGGQRLPAESLSREYFVLIGHTKAPLHFTEIGQNLRQLQEQCDVTFVKLSAMALAAAADVSQQDLATGAEPTGVALPRTERAARDRTPGRPSDLHALVPLDRRRVLDFTDDERFNSQLARICPWMECRTADAAERSGERVELAFAEQSFDCVCLEAACTPIRDPSAMLGEVYRVLAGGGLLLGTIPAGSAGDSSHTIWQPGRHELGLRLQHAGFVDVAVQELSQRRQRGPAQSGGDAWLIRAWKRAAPLTPAERACEVMNWLYEAVQPEPIPLECENPHDIVRLGRGLCQAYTIVLGDMLRAEGMDVEWITMEADNHPRGRGPRQTDTHEVIRLRTGPDEIILDPATNTVIRHALDEILANPGLAAGPCDPDERYRERGYELYATEFWYSRVTRYWTRRDLHGPRKEHRVPRVRRRAAA